VTEPISKNRFRGNNAGLTPASSASFPFTVGHCLKFRWPIKVRLPHSTIDLIVIGGYDGPQP
jgi:hypothetical protein